jgi:parvulin-like peptidyl-prolyl isomerase
MHRYLFIYNKFWLTGEGFIMEKKNIPKKDSNGKKDSQLRKRAISAIRTKQLINLGLLLVLIVIVGVGAMFIYLNTISVKVDASTPGFVKKIVELNNKLVQAKPTPAAVVNGEEISLKELESRYNLVPSDYKSLITKEEILSQMIDEKLLLQEAAKLNITASEEEVSLRIKTLLEENQITEAQFEEAITSKGLTLDTVRVFYSKETILTKLLNLEILSKIEISDKTIRKYYDNNQDLFKIPASVNVSHILICHNESLRCSSNLTKEEAFSQAEKVRGMIKPDNFAEMALEYSNEPAAKITQGNLGWVSMESPFDKTFMNATFALGTGNVSAPVETVFGYHLIKVFEKREEGLLNLSSVYDQINKTLAQEKQTEVFGVYLSEVKNQSTVINYLEKNN